ncbi:hypothetical protein ACIQU6_27890 [Streptomyces sp. NPDC090442]|uniref:hypothetical protein n=1 Tax=Streptomyces sp. NPDC090442 TaxID=3365962 RepID=UPI003803379B
MAKALARDAAELLTAHEDAKRHPAPEVYTPAEGLAHMHWYPESFRTALREVHPAVRTGRLINVLNPATTVLESRDSVSADATANALLALRRLIDALAADIE